MSWTRFFRRSRWDAERARELEAHLQIEADEFIARGLTPDEARWAAQRKLGNVLRIREEIYEMNTLRGLDTLWQDLRFGCRLLRRTPGFTVVAVLSLALGIGANMAIFQVIDAVRLRALPVRHPEGLVEVRVAQPRSRTGNFLNRYAELTNLQWEQIRARQEAFTGVLAWGPTRFNLAMSGEARPVEATYVSGSFFDVLGVSASRGRVFTAADDRPGCAAPGAVISHGFWLREYGGDATVVGRKVRLDGHAFDIIGVTPAEFLGVEVGRAYDVAVPICAAGLLNPDAGLIDKAHVWWLSVMGRLRPGWTAERATVHLRAISPSLFQQTLPAWFDQEAAKEYVSFKLEAVPCAGGFSSVRAQYGAPLWLLFGLSGVVLLASCINLANLMLARAGTRQREIAVRLATGASRWRIVRQLMTESLLLSVLGVVAGGVLARMLSSVFVALLRSGKAPVFVALPADWRMLAFAIATAGVTALAFGLMPALRATTTPVHRMMKTGGPGVTLDRRRHGLQGTLVVVQMALSMVMVGSAALFALSLHNLATFDTGHRVDRVLVADLTIGRQTTPDAAVPALQQALLDRLRATPGVESVASTAIIPMSGNTVNDNVRVDTGGAPAERETSLHRVSTGYFRTTGIPLVSGRDFDAGDRVNSKPVAIVNRTFALRLLATNNAVGRVFSIRTLTGTWTQYEIVGMAADAVYRDAREPIPPVAYLADQQGGLNRRPVLLIRSSLPPAALKATVARAIAQEGPTIGIQFSTLSQIVRDGTHRERLLAMLSAGFGVLALALAAVGIYGVLSYLVVRRRQEIGIRQALGATRLDIVRMVAGQSLGWMGIGLAAGGVLAVLTATATRSMLFGLTPTNPLALAVAGLVLASTGAAATIVPALRAGRLQPRSALREE